MFRLDGKNAVVTGAGSGIGRAIAKTFASQGARVFVLERDESAGAQTASEITAQGGMASVVACDVANASSVDAAFKSVLADAGRIDILVNNAGIAHIGTVASTTEADLDRIYAVNVKGVFLCSQAVVPAMVEAGGGVILNLASIASLIGLTDRFAYSMSKGAVLTMTRSIAVDYVKQGIRCNCVCPARVHTPFVDGYLRDTYPGREAEMFKQLSEYQPIGRMAEPEEVAALALYLCSDEASFITGQAYPIDGGVLVFWSRMKRYAQTLNLKDDPDVIAQYVEHHRAVWPEVERGLRAIGIERMLIWRLGRRLFMVMETADSFDPQRDWPRYMETNERIPEWQTLMESFQERVPEAKPGEWWALMDEVYVLGD